MIESWYSRRVLSCNAGERRECISTAVFPRRCGDCQWREVAVAGGGDNFEDDHGVIAAVQNLPDFTFDMRARAAQDGRARQARHERLTVNRAVEDAGRRKEPLCDFLLAGV